MAEKCRIIYDDLPLNCRLQPFEKAMSIEDYVDSLYLTTGVMTREELGLGD